MINKQGMVDRIRKVQAEAEQKREEADRLEEEWKELDRESIRLQSILARSVRAGEGSLGDPLLDLAFVVSGRIDSEFVDFFVKLKETWNTHQREYFVITREHFPAKSKTATVTEQCLGLIEGQLEFNEDNIFIPTSGGLVTVNDIHEYSFRHMRLEISTNYLTSINFTDIEIEFHYQLQKHQNSFNESKSDGNDILSFVIGDEKIAKKDHLAKFYTTVIDQMRQLYEESTVLK